MENDVNGGEGTSKPKYMLMTDFIKPILTYCTFIIIQRSAYIEVSPGYHFYPRTMSLTYPVKRLYMACFSQTSSNAIEMN